MMRAEMAKKFLKKGEEQFPESGEAKIIDKEDQIADNPLIGEKSETGTEGKGKTGRVSKPVA